MTTMSRVCAKNHHLRKDGHSLTEELAARAVRLEYASGHVLEQHWQTANRVLWKGVDGGLAGYEQVDHYHAFKLTEGIFLISWVEESTQADTTSPQSEGPWLTDVILDFNEMRATASWMGPTIDGGIEHVLDQALLTFIECDLIERN